MIPYATQLIDDDDINAVIDVLRSPLITQGPVVEKFEEQFKEICNSKYACAVNSATSGLHLACRALGIRDGDNVWTSQ